MITQQKHEFIHHHMYTQLNNHTDTLTDKLNIHAINSKTS